MHLFYAHSSKLNINPRSRNVEGTLACASADLACLSQFELALCGTYNGNPLIYGIKQTRSESGLPSANVSRT